MTKYVVHWPEMGITNETQDGDEETENTVQKWMENPILRKILFTIYIVGETLRLTATAIIAMSALYGATWLGLGIETQSGFVWGFLGVTALIMGIEELLRYGTNISIRYGAFYISTVTIVSLVRLYLCFKERRNSLDNPANLASSLPIETIPVLELYNRRNRLI